MRLSDRQSGECFSRLELAVEATTTSRYLQCLVVITHITMHENVSCPHLDLRALIEKLHIDTMLKANDRSSTS